MSSPARVVYIVSAGHSGSTLLDIVCGTIPGVFSTGELTYLPWQIYRRGSAQQGAPKQLLCSCGAGFAICPAWNRIISSLGDQQGFDIYQDPFRFKINTLQNERYVAGPFAWSRIGRMLFAFAAQHKMLSGLIPLWEFSLRDAVSNNWLLFDTIVRECGVQVIVDSSKSVHRMRLLHARRPENLKTIVLMRDPCGVAYSAQKLNEDPVRAALGWARQYKRIFSILRNMDGSSTLMVRYEELANRPVETRRRIAQFLDMPDPGDTLEIDTHKQHLVAGNGMRHHGRLTIRYDDAWRSGLDLKLQRRIKKIAEQVVPQFPGS